MTMMRSRANRIVGFRYDVVVAVLTLALALAPVKARARQTQNSAEAQKAAAAEQKKEPVTVPASTTKKDKPNTAVANRNHGRLVQSGMTIEYAVEPAAADASHASLTGGDDAR